MCLGLEYFTYVSCHKPSTGIIPCASLFLPLHDIFLPHSFMVRDLDCRKSLYSHEHCGKWQWLLSAACRNGATIPSGCVSLRFHFPWMEKGLWISNASDVYGEYAQYESDATHLQDEVFVAFRRARRLSTNVSWTISHSRSTWGDVLSWCLVVE